MRSFIACVLVLALTGPAVCDTVVEKTLGKDAASETSYVVRESGVPGPTVMIVGGVHGDEPAGAHAAAQVLRWPLRRGRLVVLPRANLRALLAGTRYTPDVAKVLRNLNRNFPERGDEQGELGPPRGAVATALWRLAEATDPDWLLDLHEGYDFRGLNKASVGSTIIVHPDPEAEAAADEMLAAVNSTISDEKLRFVRLRYAKKTTLARSAGEYLGVRSMILETTSKKQRLTLRARQHRLMVHAFLHRLGMLEEHVGPDTLAPSRRSARDTHVALYDDSGSSGRGVPRVVTQLGEDERTTVVRVGAAEIRAGILRDFDVVMFTGGSGSGQAKALGERGRTEVREFVEAGGGYVGVCAGAYLACRGFSWGVGVLDAKTVSSKWRRGRATVKVELTERGRQIFGHEAGPFGVLYANGPILAPLGLDELPDYTPLAVYRTEVAENGTPKGVMVDSPAIVSGRCGAGRVMCIGPHPEQTGGLGGFVPRAVQWVRRR